MRARAIWSVHDVSAESFERARHLIAAIEAAGIAPLCILIVPHGAWTEGQRSTLRDWERAGHVLGLHGWSHRATPPQTLYHRAHAAILSRDTAEHLGLDARAVADLINRGVRWFADAGLAAPQLYVPPAWALGALRSESLPAPPFRWIETLTGIHDLRARRFHVLPLAGFEADNGFRGVALRASNGASAAFARISGRPLRVAVHPHDLDLRLAGDLRRLLRTRIRSIGPDAI